MSHLAPSGSVLVSILRFNAGRIPRLVRLKLKRMAADSFAFFRGTDHLFAEAWREYRPPDVGPEIPICGDLHLENFGAYRDDDGEFLFDINDFDEAVVAPCSLDLVRCVTSIWLASELWKLSPLGTSRMVLTFLDAYREAVMQHFEMSAVDAAAPRLTRGPISEILGKTALGDQVKLLHRLTNKERDGTRRIIRSKDRHPPVDDEQYTMVKQAVEAYGEARGRADFYRVIDVSGRVAGIGSLGLERYAALIAGDGSSESNRILDIKMCTPSALRGLASRPWPWPDRSDAARVVRAQSLLQARAPVGLDVLEIGATAFRVRETIPEENRSSLDRFHEKPRKLVAAIRAAGRLTGLSHLRGAAKQPDGDLTERLRSWTSGAALDSVLASAARFAEATRLAHKQFRAERRAPEALPVELRELAAQV